MQPTPFNPFPDQDIKTRLHKAMLQKGKINQKILAALHETFEQALDQENVVLARSEKQRLVKLLVEEILMELIAENK